MLQVEASLCCWAGFALTVCMRLQQQHSQTTFKTHDSKQPAVLGDLGFYKIFGQAVLDAVK